jgi:hypothetical protein
MMELALILLTATLLLGIFALDGLVMAASASPASRTRRSRSRCCIAAAAVAEHRRARRGPVSKLRRSSN